MARSRINSSDNDIVSDSGSILWSFILGEQLEFPIVLNFMDDTTESGWEYEAVIVEGLNVSAQEEPPVTHKTDGVKTTLTYRLPDYVGEWDEATAYNPEEVVYYEDTYYKFLGEPATVNAMTPDENDDWEETTMNRMYIQIPSTLASTWAVAPLVDSPVYGFFELRVTEPNTSVYRKTWKPVRGMVEILFSPTDMVP